MTRFTAERVGECVRSGMDWHAIGQELRIHWATARTYILMARKILGEAKVPHGLYGKTKTAPDHQLVAKLWREGTPSQDIDQRVGKTNSVSIARSALGTDAVPLRPAHPKGSGFQKKKTEAVTMIELERHLVRSLGRGEYIFRNAEMREELWVKDEEGTRFRPGINLRFVSLLGLTEKRTS